MVAKHTPGPLVAHHQPTALQSGDGLNHSIMREDGTVVALIALICGTSADVRLWAAAPDLLVALRALSEFDKGKLQADYHTLIAAADAAIAKAEGR